MARSAFNKAALTKQKRLLETYREVLPSLDLKRRQLRAEKARASETLARIRAGLESIEPQIAQGLPMLSDELVDLANIVKVTAIEFGEENIMGIRLPKVSNIVTRVQPYSLFQKPFWVDRLVELLKTALELQINVQVANRRLELLDKAERVATQRYNLFDKVLIPRIEDSIKRIKVYLADAERSFVVNSKIAKRKKLEQVA